ncbi:DUF4232 domain-containing protein [Streptomyces sp. NPDC091281]|uniref:DUF4232 domain-containing protein n=1 Tax=Streptomyces sp. NPDC091281 TaxID=3365985 RepID=UPI0037F5FA69
MTRTSRPAVVTAGVLAAFGLLGACGGSDGGGGGSASSSAAPPPTSASAPTSPAPTATLTPPAPASEATGTPTATTAPAADARCHTSELRASVGRAEPGAGQVNFPLVLTNTGDRTCTVRGYPGAAFTDAAGKQLGPDPVRTPGSAQAVSLAPGRSAWSGLTYSNPQVSGAETATPRTLVVTPPNERDALKVPWTGGEVPVSGNASSVRLTVLAPGTGP